MSDGWFETRWSTVAAAVFVAVLSLAGCGSEEPAATVPAAELRGTFVSTGNPGGEGPSFTTPVTVTIAGPRIVWRASCNQAGADVEVETDRLLIGEVTSTAMGCETEQQAKQDAGLAEFFASDPSWALDGRRLTLESGSVDVELLRRKGGEREGIRVPPSAPRSLDELAAKRDIVLVRCSSSERAIDAVLGAYPTYDFAARPTRVCTAVLAGDEIVDFLLIRGRWAKVHRHPTTID